MKLTIQSLRDLNPCYDPTEFFPEGWEGTLLEVLEDERIPTPDRIWVFCKAQTEDIKSEFARWCALQVIHLWDAPEVVKEFLETGDESKRAAAKTAARDSARDAARAAAKTAARDSARDTDRVAARAAWADWDAARVAARDAWADWAAAKTAARDSARDAARAAAKTAARDAARAAAKTAARVAARDAWADWDAAGAAARETQLKKAIELTK